MENSSLTKLAQRADDTEALLANLQRQLDYVQTTIIHKKRKLVNDNDNKEDNENNKLSVDIEDILLKDLNECKQLNSLEFSKKYNIDHNDVYPIINSLEADEYVIYEHKSYGVLVLTNEGKSIIQEGAPEIQVYNAIPSNGNISHTELANKINGDIFKIGIGKALSKNWVTRDKKTNAYSRNNSNVHDEVKEQLIKISNEKESDISVNDIQELKKRKLVTNKTIKYYIIKLGKNFNVKRIKPISELKLNHINEYMINNDCQWNGPKLKEYNYDSLGGNIEPFGTLHPLMKMREEMRKILLELGFEEMATNNYVESSFWNFDTLFQPQQHPARDAHDTFFLKTPATSVIETPEYLEKVKLTHENGHNTGSIGYRYKWKIEEATKNILRTHTTAVSSRTLYKLSQYYNNNKNEFKPKKYFSIDRVFRNESVNPTHLAEFHQVEGFIIDYNLNLGHLIGIIKEFFKRIGLDKIKLKPAYNPYTEPSMEIYGYSKDKKDWIEIGNSGIFRPEMLLPMGFDPNIKVIAWGLGLERPCMIATNCKDIRTLFGPRVDTIMAKKFPFVRYDKFNVQPKDLSQEKPY